MATAHARPTALPASARNIRALGPTNSPRPARAAPVRGTANNSISARNRFSPNPALGTKGINATQAAANVYSSTPKQQVGGGKAVGITDTKQTDKTPANSLALGIKPGTGTRIGSRQGPPQALATQTEKTEKPKRGGLAKAFSKLSINPFHNTRKPNYAPIDVANAPNYPYGRSRPEPPQAPATQTEKTEKSKKRGHAESFSLFSNNPPQNSKKPKYTPVDGKPGSSNPDDSNSKTKTALRVAEKNYQDARKANYPQIKARYDEMQNWAFIMPRVDKNKVPIITAEDKGRWYYKMRCEAIEDTMPSVKALKKIRDKAFIADAKSGGLAAAKALTVTPEDPLLRESIDYFARLQKEAESVYETTPFRRGPTPAQSRRPTQSRPVEHFDHSVQYPFSKDGIQPR